jgi:hypothetical protein
MKNERKSIDLCTKKNEKKEKVSSSLVLVVGQKNMYIYIYAKSFKKRRDEI